MGREKKGSTKGQLLSTKTPKKKGTLVGEAAWLFILQCDLQCVYSK